MTCDRATADLRARYPCTPFVSLSAKTRSRKPQPRPDRRDTLATDLWPTCDALRPISNHPTAWARLPRVTDVTQQKFAWDKNLKISKVTCDRFTTAANEIRGNPVNHDQPAKTCDQRRIQLRVGSLASEIDKFHDRFWQLKAVVDLVDFNGEQARVIASIQE